MKRIYKQAVAIIAAGLFFTVALPAQKANAQVDDAYVSYNDFYQNLAPYGQWIEDPRYGYVWSPNQDWGFRPYYTNGHWAMTEYGNTWVSDYPWGWACFHYGRWTYDEYYGWLWITGSDWGPAWVSWREGGGYYGWAPLGPEYQFGAAYGNDYSCPNDWWVFIPPQYIYTGNYYSYWYGPHGNTTIIRNTTFINNTYDNNHVTYVAGPRSADIEKITHQPVQVYNLASSKNLATRVHNNTIKMFRPAQIPPSNGINGGRVAPPNVVSAPRAVSTKPQPVSRGQNGNAGFKNDIPRTNAPADAVGTHFSEPAKSSVAPQRADNHPYQWDVNRPIPQPQVKDVPEYHGQQPNSAPQIQQPARQQPQVQQPAHQQPQAPMPQYHPAAAPPVQQSRPAAAPAPRFEGGGRR